MTSTYAADDRSGTGILITPDRHITLGDHPCNRVPDVPVCRVSLPQQ